MTNKQFAMSEEFAQYCERAGVTPTARQASKYRMNRGRAFAVAAPVLKERARKEARNERDRKRRAEKKVA
jgi:hypothetical protein